MTAIFTRNITDGRYELSGPVGVLTFEPATGPLGRGGLSADGDLPPWIVADGHAVECQAALVDGGEADLWSVMEQIYEAKGRLGEVAE